MNLLSLNAGSSSLKVALFAIPLVLAAGITGWVNYAESGSPLHSGYQERFGTLGVLETRSAGPIGLAVSAAILRENFWLFGWPLSLLPLAWARLGRGRVLFYGALLAELAYRLAVPKTVVSTTGPIYVTEVVPILAIMAADGLGRIAAFGRRLSSLVTAETPIAVVAAAAICSAFFFVPFRLWSIVLGVRERGRLQQSVIDTGLPGGVVFANEIVPPLQGWTWAYFAPLPDPDLTEDWIFLRLPSGPDRWRRADTLMRRHFADRPAFVYSPFRAVRLQPLRRPP